MMGEFSATRDGPELRRLKRALLKTLVVSVALSALLGIVIVLRNSWSWFETRVVMTTLIVAVGSLMGLACDVSRTPRGVNLLPKAGLALTGLAAGLIMFAMWADVNSSWYWKMFAVVAAFAFATVHVSLLSVARLASRYQWVYYIAVQVIFGLAAVISFMFVFNVYNEIAWRFVVALTIVDAALTMTIPLLHRISRTDENRLSTLNALESRNVSVIDAEIVKLKKQIVQLEMLRSEITGEGEGGASM